MTNFRRYLLFALAVVCGFQFSLAQTHRNCQTMEADQELREKFPEMGTLDEFEEWLAPLVRAYQSQDNSTRAVSTIPVVFHVIHNGQSVGSGDNISAALINAQLTQLNNDFRKIVGTSGNNSDPRGADSELEFCMATVDPNGNSMAEAGINRINRSSQGWSAPPYGVCLSNGGIDRSYIDNTIKPQSQWDPNDYLNIWLMDLNCGLLGYAQFPSNSGLGGLSSNGGAASTDGVVVLTNSVGSTTSPNPSGGSFNAGRTLTHELGHFFGLRHIWGDSNCGNDFCNDTPTQQGPSSGCPNTTTCDGNADMVE
ncbi:MAG: M43 family zinc metalloprotease, partial [Bacteroidota bacterium]